LASLFKTPQDCNGIDADGAPALIIAAYAKSPEAVKYLLTHGADVNYKIKSEDEDINGKTALDIAIDRDNTDTYLAFLNAKLTPEMAGKLICLVETLSDIEKLIGFGVDINKILCDEEPMFIKAVESNKEDFIKLLIKKGANINIKDSDGMSALFVAQPEGMKILVDNKVDVSATFKGKTIFQDAVDTYCSFFSNGYELNSLKVLLDNGYKLPEKIDGKSPLEYVKTKPYEYPTSPNSKIKVDETKDKERYEKKKNEVVEFLKNKGVK
jgi:ankyrin repeat protein